MGYHIKFLPHKKSIPQWKVQFISFKKCDTQNSKAKKPKREWDIAKDRWLTLGFSQSMNLSEAKARARQLNAQNQLKRQEEQFKQISAQQNQFQLRFDSVLPSEFVAEFEKVFVRKSDSQTEQGLRRTTRSHVIWRAAQRMIVAVGVEPSHWVYSYRDIYEYMIVQKMSVRYARGIRLFRELGRAIKVGGGSMSQGFDLVPSWNEYPIFVRQKPTAAEIEAWQVIGITYFLILSTPPLFEPDIT